VKTTLNPNALQWARRRAGFSQVELAKELGLKDPALITAWERTGNLTFGQVEKLSDKTHTPIGYLFLPYAPEEQLPINDFRTIGDVRVDRPNVDVLEVIYQAQMRQAWFREYLISNDAKPLNFVGQINRSASIEGAAKKISSAMRIGTYLSQTSSTWAQNLIAHFDAVEEMGILVMRSSIVGSNNRRKLSVEDFRGFALSDEYAPVVFINSSDSKAAQLFTLVHEVVHIWIGESSINNLSATYDVGHEVEGYCNRVAAEILVPLEELKKLWIVSNEPGNEIRRIGRIYKVSTLVMARRVRDAGFIDQNRFNDFYKSEYKRYFAMLRGGPANIYRTIPTRVSRRFAHTVITSAMEGKTMYRDALHLLGITNINTFHLLARKLGHTG
jgi:Zn-dependent peptidase ImmA (M78 family)/transcriptional regulator with XRE-family HTH domain